MAKNFKLKAEDIKDLIPRMGGCMATDKITVDGLKVNYMYRETPDNEIDSGWRFLSGTEDQEYLDNAENTMVYDVNTIANYDPAIIPYLHLPYPVELERAGAGDHFDIVTQ